jgi:HK97 gp10 family phage protein
MQVDVKITGMEECIKRLEKLSQEFAAKTLVSATYTSMQPMEKKAEQLLVSKGAVRTGTLKKSISRKKIVRAKDQTVTIMVGINKSTKGVDPKGRKVWPVKYAHLVEAKKPFMREAYDQTAQEVLTKYIRVLERKLNKAGV